MAQSIADFLDTLGSPSNVVPIGQAAVANEERKAKAFWLPAKSFSWKYDDGANPCKLESKAGATIMFNKKVHGRISYNSESDSWDAYAIVKMRKPSGEVDRIEAKVSGLDTRDEAGRQVSRQWFRLAWRLGWHS